MDDPFGAEAPVVAEDPLRRAATPAADESTFTDEPLDDGAPPPYESVVMGSSSAVLPPAEPGVGTPPRAPAAHHRRVGSGAYGAPHNADFAALAVSDPVRQGEGVAAYVSYKVTSRVALPGYRPGEAEVIRRFRDFAWLQRRLRAAHPGVIVPPLPERKAVQKYRMAADFIEARRAALGVFLARVAAHPALRGSPDLRLFLQASETEFAVEVSRSAAEGGAAAGAGLDAPAAASAPARVARKTLGAAAGLLRSLSRSAEAVVAGVAGGGGGGLRVGVPPGAAAGGAATADDARHAAARAYVDELEGHLGEAHRHAARLVRAQAEACAALEAFGAAAAALGRAEAGGAPAALAELGERARAVAAVRRAAADGAARCLEAPLKEFARAAKAARAAMADRDAAAAAAAEACAEVERARARLARARHAAAAPGAGYAGEAKVGAAERELAAAEARAEAAAAAAAAVAAAVAPELDRFQAERAEELGYVLRDFAAGEAAAAAEAGALWRAMVPGLPRAAQL